MAKRKCKCHLFKNQVCDICQGITGNEKDAEPHNRVSLKPGKRPRYGYHTVKIKKGVLGELSKIQEELDELKDAEKQGVKILIACELADLYGAIRVYARKYGLKMGDLHEMAKLTRNAFDQGDR